MNQVQTWGVSLYYSLDELGARLIGFLPSLIGALLVFGVGLIVARVLSRAVEKGLKLTKIDRLVEKSETTKKIEEAGLKLNFSKVLGELVRWFLILVFLTAATEILHLSQFTNFLNSILMYLPNVVVSVVILVIAFLLANFTYKFVRGSVRAAGVVSASVLAMISKWAILIFGILTALVQLGIAESIINTIFIGVIAAFSLAIGLAFGLGGREEAASLIRKLREEISERK